MAALLLHHSIENAESAARGGCGVGAFEDEESSELMQQREGARLAGEEMLDEVVLMDLRAAGEGVAMMAMPTLPPMLRMRLKMLVAFPIFSGAMWDIAATSAE